jgi:hypothetical protein
MSSEIERGWCVSDREGGIRERKGGLMSEKEGRRILAEE